MRLSVFIAEQPSTQLIIDLNKIYLNYLPESDLTETKINEILAKPSTYLFMTMFNERHIGAVKVETESTKATLSQLCIREITRRRGIGKNLLKQIEKYLISEGVVQVQYDLQEVTKDELSATQAFLVESGYNITDTMAQKQL